MKLEFKIAHKIKEAGGKCYYVGGYVRDNILGLPSKDIDIEVFNLEPDTLLTLLETFGKVDTVGKAFGVFKMGELDISIPRTERKEGEGYKGFLIESNPFLSLKEAAKRRDFSINAIYKDVITGEFFDPYNGLKDISIDFLRPVSESFKEDPLRVLRGFQFIARFGFTPANSLIEYSKELSSEFHTLPKERIWTEFHKWATKGKHFIESLNFLQASTWIKHFPELEAMVGCKQNPMWHPEGDVWEHTKHVIQETFNLNPEKKLALILAALCHDIGKPNTTVFKEGKWIAPKHAIEGVDVSKSFLNSINAPNAILNEVPELVQFHMARTNDVTPRTVRRLMVKLKHTDIETLCLLMEADKLGRPPTPKTPNVNIELIKKYALEIQNEPESIKPLILGSDLIKLGFTQGQELGDKKKQMFDLQIEHNYNREQLLGILNSNF